MQGREFLLKYPSEHKPEHLRCRTQHPDDRAEQHTRILSDGS